MSKNKKANLTTQTIVVLALLLATEIVLSRFFSLSFWNLKIGFSFLPIALAARLCGPVGGMIVAGLGDFIRAIIFPIGPYFPGFTITAVLTGLCFGLLFYKKCNFKKIIFAVITTQIIGGLLLNTLWISILYKTDFIDLLPIRSVQVVVLIVLQTATLNLLFYYLPKLDKTLLFQKI